MQKFVTSLEENGDKCQREPELNRFSTDDIRNMSMSDEILSLNVDKQLSEKFSPLTSAKLFDLEEACIGDLELSMASLNMDQNDILIYSFDEKMSNISITDDKFSQSKELEQINIVHVEESAIMQ